MPSVERFQGYREEMAAIRHALHAEPELAFEEHRTGDLIARKLDEYGIETHRGVGRTGIVGVLCAGDGQGAVGLRADMDALPMREENGLPYASCMPGRMHACGHDGHTAMLLGAARHLAETRRFDGTVNFIFQPAEEIVSGARAMLEDGLFERFPCDCVFGMHNTPDLPAGKFAIRPGAMMAGAALFDITITGRGAHAARPEKGIDPVLAACHVATALQSIISRTIAPADTAVLSVTRIETGTAYNVIPDFARLSGTARSFTTGTMRLIETGVRRVAAGVAAGFGAAADIDFQINCVPLVNDPAETRALADAAAELVGEDNLDRECPRLMPSDDFAILLEARPGAYIRIGNGGDHPVHSPNYDFNDEALAFGAALFATIAERKLPQGK